MRSHKLECIRRKMFLFIAGVPVSVKTKASLRQRMNQTSDRVSDLNYLIIQYAESNNYKL